MAPEPTYADYRDKYRGRMEEGDFEAALPSARARLVAITGAEVPEGAAEAWSMALCAMCDHVAGADGSGLKSETVGSTSYAYADARAGATGYDAVAPWLAGTGLLYRGAGCRR